MWLLVLTPARTHQGPPLINPLQNKRRLITRLAAIVPTIIVVALYGEHGTARLLILSQVILSMQLSFAVFPLVSFTSNHRMMGEFVNARWLKYLAWVVAIVIAGLNAWLLIEIFRGH